MMRLVAGFFFLLCAWLVLLSGSSHVGVVLAQPLAMVRLGLPVILDDTSLMSLPSIVLAAYDARVRNNATLPVVGTFSARVAILGLVRLTATNPAQLVASAMDLVENGKAIVLGGGNSFATCTAIDLVAESLNVAFVSNQCSATAFAERDRHPNFVGTSPTEDKFADAILALLKQMSWNRVCLIYEDTRQGPPWLVFGFVC